MKKIILLFLEIIFLSTNSFAQKIVIDKTEADGFRSIMTDQKTCRDLKDKWVFSFGVAACTDNQHLSYDLAIELGCYEGESVKKGAKVLIKTFKGDVIEASVDLDNFAKGSVATIGTSVYTIWKMPIMIELTHEQLQELATDGIQKIRIEGSPENFEKEYKKDKTSKVIKERLDLVDQALAKKSSFSDGF